MEGNSVTSPGRHGKGSAKIDHEGDIGYSDDAELDENAVMANCSESPSMLQDAPTTQDGIIQYWLAAKSKKPSGTMLSAIDHFEIHVLGGAAVNRYVALIITSRSFWTSLNAQSPVTTGLGAMQSDESLKPIFLEFVHGNPLGDEFNSLLSDQRRATGLFINAYGQHNLAPCRNCEKRFAKSENGGKKLAHGMTSMYGCMSLRGMANGSCGNCVAMLEAHKCFWREPDVREFSVEGSLYAERPGDLSRDNSPSVVEFDAAALRELYEGAFPETKETSE